MWVSVKTPNFEPNLIFENVYKFVTTALNQSRSYLSSRSLLAGFHLFWVHLKIKYPNYTKLIFILLSIHNSKKTKIMEALSIEQIKSSYPDEWVLLDLEGQEATKIQKGIVLLHSKDYLELCYKSSEIAKEHLTTILFTGTQNHHRKWITLRNSFLNLQKQRDI